MPPLGVVPDFITCFHPNPLGNRTILLLFLGQESLDSKNLVRRHGESTTHTTKVERAHFILLYKTSLPTMKL